MQATYILVLIFALSCHISCEESLSEAQKIQEDIDSVKERITSHLHEKFGGDMQKVFEWYDYLMHYCGVPHLHSLHAGGAEPTVKMDVFLRSVDHCVKTEFQYHGQRSLLPVCPQKNPNATSAAAPKPSKSCNCVCPTTTDEPEGRFFWDWIHPLPEQSVVPWNLFDGIHQILISAKLDDQQKETSVDELTKAYIISVLMPEYKKSPIGATDMYAYFQRKCSRNMPTLKGIREKEAAEKGEEKADKDVAAGGGGHFLFPKLRAHLRGKANYFWRKTASILRKTPNWNKEHIRRTAVVDLHSCIAENWDGDDYHEDVCQVEPAAPCDCVCPVLAKAETHVLIYENTLGKRMTQGAIDIATKAYEYYQISPNFADLQAYLEGKMSAEFGGTWKSSIFDDPFGFKDEGSHELSIRFLIKQDGKKRVSILLYRE